MSNRTGRPAGALSQEDLQSIMALQGRAGDFVELWEKEYREKVDKWEPALLKFGSAFATALDRYKATLELKKAQEQAAIEFAFAVMGMGIGSSLNWIALSLKKTKNISKFSEAMQEVIAGGIQDGIKFGVGEAQKLIKPDAELSFVMPSSESIPSVIENLDTLINNAIIGSFKSNILKVIEQFNKLFKKAVDDKDFVMDIFVGKCNRDLAAAEAHLRNWAKTSANPLLDAIYYRAKPDLPSVGNMARMIERGLWAKWVLANTKVERLPLPGRDLLHYTRPGKAVEGRLVELRVMKVGGAGDPGPSASELKRKIVNEEKATWNEAHVPHLPNFGWATSNTIQQGTADKTEVKKLVDWALAYRRNPEIIGGVRKTGKAVRVVNSTPY